MSEMKTSVDAYIDLGDAIPSQKNVLAIEDLKRLLDLMKEELIVLGGSPLIAAAYSACCPALRKMYSPTYFSLAVATTKRTKIPHFDAWWLIILLSQYLTSGSIAEESNQHLPFFFKGLKYKDATTDGLNQALKVIDAGIPEHRQKMFTAFSSGKSVEKERKNWGVCDSVKPMVSKSALSGLRSETDNRASGVRQFVSVDKGTKDPVVIKQTDDQERQIRQSDRKQPQNDLEGHQKKLDEQAQSTLERAEEWARQIEQDANQRAQEIIDRAGREAETKISEAKNRLADMVKDSKSQAVDKEAEGIQRHFLDVRTAMQEANERIRKLEDSFSEATTKKVSAQFLELFNLIADAKDSAFDLARNKNDTDLENAAYNMDAFLDMISEYMADYGIQPIATPPNSPFSGKCHAPVNGDPQFDPRTAIVKISKRSGFLWGNLVLQKERVEI